MELLCTATGANYLDVAIFRDVSDNGVVEIGDVADVINFNNDQIGSNTDLEVQHSFFSNGSCDAAGNETYCVSTTGVPHTFIAPATGQYVIGISSANDSQGRGWRVEILSREGGEPPTPVPVDNGWALLLMIMLVAGAGLMVQRHRGEQA